MLKFDSVTLIFDVLDFGNHICTHIHDYDPVKKTSHAFVSEYNVNHRSFCS